MLKRLQLAAPLLLAVGSGLLLSFSLPPSDVEWLGWFALAPLFVAVRGRRGLHAAGLGLMAGLACGAAQVDWRHGGLPLAAGYTPFIWLGLLLAFVAVVASAARKRWDDVRWVVWVACAGVATEWLSTFTPLPMNIALSQHRALWLIPIVAVTGIWGVSALLWLSNAALADALLRGRAATAGLGIAAAAVALVAGCSALASPPGPGTARLRVAAIQEFIIAEVGPAVGEPPQAGEAPDREAMTRDAAARGARLVVWSEECLGNAFNSGASSDPTAELARELRVYLVVGYSTSDQPLPSNCAAIFLPDGAIAGVHKKMYLYMGEAQTARAGQDARAFPTPLGRIGVEICFDSCHPEVTRHIARDGARLIAVPNHDPPAPRGIFHRLHAAIMPFRAAENHVLFVRCDANGLSEIIDAEGRVVAQSPLFREDTLIGDVTPGDGRGTFYTRWGDWLPYLSLAAMLGLAVGGRRRANRASPR